jgi:hypothetical protein
MRTFSCFVAAIALAIFAIGAALPGNVQPGVQSGGSGTNVGSYLWTNATGTSVELTNKVLPVCISNIWDTTGNLSVDPQNRKLYDQTPALSANWNVGILYDTSGFQALSWRASRRLLDAAGLKAEDWDARTLFDSSVLGSVNWDTRTLYDSSGALPSISWASRTLADSSAAASVAWGNRVLRGPDGSTANLDWSRNSDVRAINFTASSVTNNGLTASTLVGTDANKAETSVTVGSGLTLSAGTLSASGGSGIATLNGFGTNTTFKGFHETNDNTGQYIDITNGLISLVQSNNTANVTNGISLSNNVPATVGAQKPSPGIQLAANGWKTAATAGSQSVKFLESVIPLQLAASPGGWLQWDAATNNAAFRKAMSLSWEGNLTNSGDLYFGGDTAGTPAILSGPHGANVVRLDANNAGAGLYLRGAGGVNFEIGATLWGTIVANEWRPGAPSDANTDLGDSGNRFRAAFLRNNVVVSADQTSTSVSLATTTLSAALLTGRRYEFYMVLFVSDSVAADGCVIDFNGGTATASPFRCHVTSFDTALNLSTQLTSLSATATMSTLTGASMIEVHGHFNCSGSGTFIPRFAQNAHTTGTLTLSQGSHLIMHDLVP